MHSLKHILPTIFASILLSCGGGDDGPKPDPVVPPDAATLVFPDNNTECNEGTILSDTESAVIFKWNASEHTDSYTINLRNLDTGSSENLNSNNNELSVTILRGIPYAWSVTSKSNSTSDTAESDEWKFYNAGVATESHPPFPAGAINPKMGASVNAGTITLTWEVSDVDDDIVSYDVFIDESNPPMTLVGSPTSDSMDYEVVSGKVYYWRVVTKDDVGNTSNSEVFQFKVN